MQMPGWNAGMIHVSELLVRLFRYRSSSQKTLYYQFLRFVADVLDHHESWERATDDPLQCPLPVGGACHLPIDPRVKMAVAHEAAKGDLGKSGRAICASLRRFRGVQHVQKGQWNIAIGNQWMSEGAGIEYMQRQSVMSSICRRAVGLAMDATRFDGFDSLFFVVQDGYSGKCSWAPPQVRGVVKFIFRTNFQCTKAHFQNMKKL